MTSGAVALLKECQFISDEVDAASLYQQSGTANSLLLLDVNGIKRAGSVFRHARQVRR
jgi:hypothetical protein